MRFCSRACANLANRKHAPVEFDGRIYYRRPTGYYFTVDGRALHRDVWEADQGRAVRPGYVVHHADGDVGNNAPSNLMEMERGAHIGLHNVDKKPNTAGERNGGARLAAASVEVIKRRLLDGDTYAAIARDAGVSQEAIGLIARGKRWAHVSPALPMVGRYRRRGKG